MQEYRVNNIRYLMVPTLSRSTAKSPLLHEPKLLPPEPTASNQSEEDEDEEDEEEEEEDPCNDDYVAAVCQYTTVLKETPPGFNDPSNKYEVNLTNIDQVSCDWSPGRHAHLRLVQGTAAAATDSDVMKRTRLSSGSGSVTCSGQRDKSSSERLIEYCEEEDPEDEEDAAAHLAVSGKLAIHLDTGETSREFCLNRLDTESSARTHTRDDR